ncbi:MAG TPA: DNA cytosine methyltransferase [Longimicrobiaceae bacterium]|jgi:DNA (cytosine-5)-methyltransferase 1|nr:DNA cytosine methyltransferase [Longimicrobiaceae bacterium]
MPAQLKAVSLFSGCGGFDWGAQQAGVEIIWANDVDPHAATAYRGLFPNVEFHEGDIRGIGAFPEADVLIGCYPCTGFSVAARRRSPHRGAERELRANEGNFLYQEFLRALRQVRPKYLFVENVKGMVCAEDGWFLAKQVNCFRHAGYSISLKRLKASAYGVSQQRERVFIVGVRSDVVKTRRFKYAFPEPTHGPGTTHPYATLHDTIGGMPLWPEGEYCESPFHGHYLTRNRKRGWGDLSYTIVAHAHHVPLHPLGEPMQNIGQDAWALQGGENRRLSWRECAAIQGLPLHVEPSGSLMNKHRVVGNAVPPAFGRNLLAPVVALESEE